MPVFSGKALVKRLCVWLLALISEAPSRRPLIHYLHPLILCQAWGGGGGGCGSGGGDLFTVTSWEVYTLDTDPPVHYSDWEWVDKLGHSFTLEENWINHMVPIQTSMRLGDIIPCEEPVLFKRLNRRTMKTTKLRLERHKINRHSKNAVLTLTLLCLTRWALGDARPIRTCYKVCCKSLKISCQNFINNPFTCVSVANGRCEKFCSGHFAFSCRVFS